jgi:hypothetical protein
MAMQDWTGQLPNLGATAAIIWLLVHIFRVLLPDLIMRVIGELDRQRVEYLSALSEFRKELGEQRAVLERLTEVVEQLSRRLENGGR